MIENTRKNYKIIIRAAENNDYYEHNTDKILFKYNGEWVTYKSNGVDVIVPKTNIIMIEITEE